MLPMTHCNQVWPPARVSLGQVEKVKIGGKCHLNFKKMSNERSNVAIDAAAVQQMIGSKYRSKSDLHDYLALRCKSKTFI
jgi:hypothetical protein